MTQETSRQRFLARVLGLVTVGALAPRAVTRAVMGEPERSARGKPAFRLQAQDRAVARRDGSA